MNFFWRQSKWRCWWWFVIFVFRIYLLFVTWASPKFQASLICSQCFHSLLKVHVSSWINSRDWLSYSWMSLNASAVLVRAKFREKEISLLVSMRISPRWQRNCVWFNESPRALRRIFVASFRRLFARTKDEIRRTSPSFLLHSTVSVPVSLPPCRRRQYYRFCSW